MNWIQRYKMRQFFRNAIWIYPVLAIPAALVTVHALFWTERQIGWRASFDPASLLSLFRTLAGAMLTFIVFLSLRGKGVRKSKSKSPPR